MNVRDSKKISDWRILEMAPDIRMICPHSIIAIWAAAGFKDTELGV